jgi:hypothetical protein
MINFKLPLWGLWILIGFLCIGSVEGAETASSMTEAKQPDDWKFNFAAYLWLPSIRGTSATRAGNTKITLKDIIEDLEMITMVTAGIHKGNGYVFGDAVFLDLENDIRVTPRVDADIELEAWIAHIGAGYRVIENDDFFLAVLAGGRYLYVGVTSDVLFVDVDVSQNAWNGIVGVEGRYELPRNWHVFGHLDAGTGDTKFTWQAMGSVGYHFKKVDAFVGYRHLVWDFDKDDDFGKVYKDLTVTGPYVGVKFKF